MYFPMRYSYSVVAVKRLCSDYTVHQYRASDLYPYGVYFRPVDNCVPMQKVREASEESCVVDTFGVLCDAEGWCGEWGCESRDSVRYTL